MCTLKSFPYVIEHTIQWARDAFEGAKFPLRQPGRVALPLPRVGSGLSCAEGGGSLTGEFVQAPEAINSWLDRSDFLEALQVGGRGKVGWR